nr:unnamed protein product [Timema poppensis]
MPFLSKDWRSPGEEWVKTEEGWEKKKILECGRHLYNIEHDSLDDTRCQQLVSLSSDFDYNTGPRSTQW